MKTWIKKKKEKYFPMGICMVITASTILAYSIFFFSVLRTGQGDNDCHIPVFFPCRLSVPGDLAAKSRQMSYRKSGQTVG